MCQRVKQPYTYNEKRHSKRRAKKFQEINTPH
jgi:hypothetical protein